MERDKRGRFVKKAQTGTQLLPILQLRNGKQYKLRQGVSMENAEPWLAMAMQDPDKYEMQLGQYYEPQQEIDNSVIRSRVPGFNFNNITGSLNTNNSSENSINTTQTGIGGISGARVFDLKPSVAPHNRSMLNQRVSDAGTFVPTSTVSNLAQKTLATPLEGMYYDRVNGTSTSNETIKGSEVESAGMNVSDEDSNGNSNTNFDLFKTVDKTKLANFLELARAGIGAAVNNKIAKRALEAEKPFLQDVSESHRSVYGDYRALIEGEKAAARLRNAASKPMTSDGALQQQMMMDAQIKGQEYIDKGRAQDDAMIRQTREVAWQQEKENQQQRHAAAMTNKQAMLMSEKNKASIMNSRDSANFSQVLAPLLAGTEQRLRNEGVLQQRYQDYYDNALVKQDVWNNYRDNLSESQKNLAKTFATKGKAGVDALLKDNTQLQGEWNSLQQIMNNEIIRRQALIKGAVVNPQFTNTDNTYSIDWGSGMPVRKKGGTIYKAKLTKRTKDNDRGAKSIESSKKLASRLLEKAIDSLYTYDQVEIIAKPSKKKRKYQAGGGLPFVNFSPVFATSETGAPTAASTKKESKSDDLTTKDILELLKDVDGLPADIDAIQAALSSFILFEDMDPLGLDSSSNIASRYMKIIGQIKKAKANKQWYDKAYDRLRDNNALNELAVDSRGSFIGMNGSSDFARFTPKQVANNDIGDYQILTNGELLHLRANTSLAPFDANIIQEVANGISMDQINDHISKVIQDLGSDKQTTQVFGNQSKEVLAGLKSLQLAAQEVGQDLSISQLYEANVFNESQMKQADLALNYLYSTLPTNMQALLFAKTGSMEGARQAIKNLVDSKLSSTTKLEFSPKNTRKATTSGKTGNVVLDGLDLSPAQMLQQGFGERETIVIQDATSTGLKVEAVTMPITKDGNKPLGSATLEDITTSQYGGVLDFTNASMGGKIVPFEGRRNIAVDGSKLYSMYLPIDQDEWAKGNIVPDLALIDKVNAINKTIKDKEITDPKEINELYTQAGLPVYMNEDGTVIPTFYRRFGVLNGTAIDNAFGADFVANKYLKEIEDEDVINSAIAIMNQGRSKEDKIEYDAESFFNFGGLLGDYDSIYQGTVFIPISNDVFLGIAGSGQTITSTEANALEAKQQQHQRVSATYKNPGQLR